MTTPDEVFVAMCETFTNKCDVPEYGIYRSMNERMGAALAAAEHLGWKLTQAAEIARLREALEWYGEQSRLARLIHSEGDAGRHAIAKDGGMRARVALTWPEPPE